MAESEPKPEFPPIHWWHKFVRKPGDLPQYKRPEFYEYYRTKFEIALAAVPQRIAEIGVRWGYSAYSFLLASPKARYVGFDILEGPHGGVKGIDTFDYVREMLARHFPDATVILNHCNTQQLEGLCGSYDFIHIDGDHTEAGCRHDLDLAMAALEPGGTILVDDYEYIAGVTRAADKFCRERSAEIAEKFSRHSLRGELVIRKAAS